MNSDVPSFEYEDFLEQVIASKLQSALKYDPSGKLGDLETKPRRLQQQSWRAKFDDPSLHNRSPHIVVSTEGPTTCSLSQPYQLTVTATHKENPVGNPDRRPVRFSARQAALKIEADDTTQYMLLLHRESKPLRELQPVYGRMPPVLDEDAQQTKDSAADNDNIRLEVGSTYATEVTYDLAHGWGEPLELDEQYSICFKNSRISDWEWDSKVEEQEGQDQEERQQEAEKQEILIPTSNLVHFTTIP